MKTYFLLLYYGVMFECFAEKTSSNEDYDLTNIFMPSFRNDSDTLPNIPGVFYKNVTVDVEKLDIGKMRKKLENMMQTQVMDLEDIKETRRQSLYYSTFSKSSYSTASEMMTRTKIADLMLQTIYMARHKLKALEQDPNFRKTDTGYRIGYLYKMMRRYLKKLRDIFKIIKDNHFKCTKLYYDWAKANWMTEKTVILYTKALKLHNDFLYMWWVMIKVDRLYMEAMNLKPDLPKSLKKTAGITDDEKDEFQSKKSKKKHDQGA